MLHGCYERLMPEVTIRHCPTEHFILAARAAKAHLEGVAMFNTFEYFNVPGEQLIARFDTHYTKVGNLIVSFRENDV